MSLPPFFQLAALVDVIAAAQHNLGAFEPRPLTLIICHAQCFARHTPSCVDMPRAATSTYSGIADHPLLLHSLSSFL